ncbi:unnamed protein product [Ophioblennius macclurei]
MHHFAVLALLVASALADTTEDLYTFDPPVGSGSGTSYSLSGDGNITAVRMWERYNNYVYGLQLRFGTIWSTVAGYQSGTPVEFDLCEGETIVQVSGKYSHYINYLTFSTNMGRSISAGNPSGNSFSMYAPKFGRLAIVSGRYHGALTSVASHWLAIPPHYESPDTE